MFQDRRGLKSSAASSENRLKPVVLRTHFSGFSRGVAQEFIPGQWFSDLQNLGGAVEQCSPRVRIFLCGQTRVGVWSLRSLVSATFTSGSPVAEKWNGDEGMRGDGGDETPQRMKATQRSRRPNTENRKVSRSRSQSSPTIPFISRILVSALTSKLNAAGTETGPRGFAPDSCCARQVERDKGRSVARASAREFGGRWW